MTITILHRKRVNFRLMTAVVMNSSAVERQLPVDRFGRFFPTPFVNDLLGAFL